MNNYIVLSNHSLNDLQIEADILITKGYLPTGGITSVTHKGSFSTVYENQVDYNSERYHMRIKFLQAFYKPKSNSI